MELNGHEWYWMVLDVIEWYWMALNGIEWYWMVLNRIEWYWVVLNGIEWSIRKVWSHSLTQTEWVSDMARPREACTSKNIGTKSINRNDIMVFLAMFNTTIYKTLCFWVLIIRKWVIIC